MATLIDLVLLWPAVALSVNTFTDITLPKVDLPSNWERPNDSYSRDEDFADTLRVLAEMAIVGTAIFFVLAPYYIATERSSLQGTLGKRVMRLRVVDVNGNRISAGRAMIRFMARLLSYAPWLLGFVMAAFTRKKQALHDLVAGTLVVVSEEVVEAAHCTGCGHKVTEHAAFCQHCGSALRSQTALFQYAGFLRRALAVVIDILIMAGPIFITTAMLIPQPSREHQKAMAEFYDDRLLTAERREAFVAFREWFVAEAILVFLLFSLYAAAAEASPLQGTFGKRAVGLRVVDLQGGRVGLGRAFGRCGARLLSAFSWHIGFVMAAFTQRKQTLHDIVTGTLVVRNAPSSTEDRAMLRPPPLPSRHELN